MDDDLSKSYDDYDGREKWQYVLTLAVRYGISVLILIIFVGVLFATLAGFTLPDNLAEPLNVTENESTDSVNNSSNVRVFLVENVTIEDTSVTYGNRTGTMAGVIPLDAYNGNFTDETDLSCVYPVENRSREYVGQSENRSYIVYEYTHTAYPEDSQQRYVVLYDSEGNGTLNSRLLYNGYGVPTQNTTKSLGRVSKNASERDAGFWKCVPEDEEDNLL